MIQKFLVALLTSVSITSYSVPRKPKRLPPSSASTTICQHLGRKALEMTNAFRAKKRLRKLIWHPGLAEVGRKHSGAMANDIVEFGHDGFQERLSHLPIKSAAENVYMANYETDLARYAVDGWIQSPGHLKNLVGDFTHCGIGVYKNAEGFWYFTQIFASF